MASIIRLARGLRLHVVAEGIEEQGQLSALEALGCDFGQSYHFARPLRAEALERAIGAQSWSPLAPPDLAAPTMRVLPGAPPASE